MTYIAFMLLGVLVAFLMNFDFKEKTLNAPGFSRSLLGWAIGMLIGTVFIYLLGA